MKESKGRSGVKMDLEDESALPSRKGAGPFIVKPQRKRRADIANKDHWYSKLDIQW